ncbi:hypothetical protein AAZX31_15G231400 [Glycine max]
MLVPSFPGNFQEHHDLNLSYPKMIDIAVQANMVCGIQSNLKQAEAS